MQLESYKNREKLLDLLRLALGTQNRLTYRLSNQDWSDVFSIFQQQGIIAVVMHGISNFKANELCMPTDTLFKWMGKAFTIESMVKRKFKIEKEFALKMLERDIPVVVLKGSAFGVYYPKFETRECGDLDCYMLGKKDEGDVATVAIGGKMENGGYKHSHLFYKGLTIENHQYLTSFDNTKNGIRTERLLQKLIKEDYNTMGDSCLLTPSPLFNAFFLIKHANRHFIKEGINLRFLLDWFFLLKSEQHNIDWKQLFSMMKSCHIYNFACVMTALCVEWLGMKDLVEPVGCAAMECNAKMRDKVLDDILTYRPVLFKESMVLKCSRILRRLCRMWYFRSLADEGYMRLVWNTMVYNSITNRKVKL